MLGTTTIDMYKILMCVRNARVQNEERPWGGGSLVTQKKLLVKFES